MKKINTHLLRYRIIYSLILVGFIFTSSNLIAQDKITLLNALIPPLIVVIGIPNCIYFLNKYHTNYIQSTIEDVNAKKINALIDMVSKMGVVTLFCNITAAIGFFVFALTKSPLLKEFGWVSGINIMAIIESLNILLLIFSFKA